VQNAISSPTTVRKQWAKPRSLDGLRLAALVGALLVLGAAGSRLDSGLRRPAGSADLDGAGWEGRRLVAQMLWLKTHAVLHAGVEEREARPGEERTRAAEMHHHGSEGGEKDAAGHDSARPHDADHHSAFVFVIPPAREDFRGLLGDLERAVKPYAGSKGQVYSKDPEQTLPFYRLITWADPHFIQGYTIGASFIDDNGKRTDQALAFLHEGERANPDSFEIQTELGHFYLVFKKDYPTAETHLRRALDLMPRARVLTELEEDARADAFRWLTLTYRKWGKPEEAVRVAREGRALVGPDATLDLTLRTHGRR
jgi:hypothetical protein